MKKNVNNIQDANEIIIPGEEQQQQHTKRERREPRQKGRERSSETHVKAGRERTQKEGRANLLMREPIIFFITTQRHTLFTIKT
jgi:hypothetical protein